MDKTIKTLSRLSAWLLHVSALHLWKITNLMLHCKTDACKITCMIARIFHYVWHGAIHVRSLIWVWIIWKTGLIDGKSHFRMRIILGMILVWFLVFHVCVPDCSRNGSRVCPYLWVQEEFVKFRQSTQNAQFLKRMIPVVETLSGTDSRWALSLL